ncbi:cupin domain-containing protein [Sphingobium mellinum]|uniref:cupin domain-containing protein n=1 Tax=Sphingobium mellinum TaxID=1387166 RepID=UPI0030EBDB5F
MEPAHDQGNLLRLPERQDGEERFEDLLRRPGVRIERIVSRGHVTPVDQPYIQDWDEWVLVVAGAAELLLEGVGMHRLERGDHLLIPAGVPHRVTHTDDPTVWLAVHIGEPEA